MFASNMKTTENKKKYWISNIILSLSRYLYKQIPMTFLYFIFNQLEDENRGKFFLIAINI